MVDGLSHPDNNQDALLLNDNGNLVMHENKEEVKLTTRPIQREAIVYHYKARGLSGQKIEGEIQSFSPDGAVAALQEGGIVVTSIEPLKSDRWWKIQPKLWKKLDERNMLLESWAFLMESDHSAQEAIFRLSTVVYSPFLSRALSRVHMAMQQGRHVADALAEQRMLPASWTAVLSQVQEHGDYVKPLRLLTKHAKHFKQVKREMISLMIGPSVLLGLLTLWGYLLLTHVLPSVYGFLSGMNVEHTPLPIDAWVSNLRTLMVFVLAGVFSFWFIGRGDREVGWLHTTIPHRTPLIGPLVEQMQLLNTTTSLLMQVEAGVHIVTAFENLSKGVRNPFIKKQLKNTASSLRHGTPMGLAIEEIHLFNSSHRALIISGHESGKIDQMLNVIQKSAEVQLFDTLERLSVSLRSMIVVMTGLMVGVVVFSFFALLLSTLGAVAG